jgi:hypothetical protein
VKLLFDQNISFRVVNQLKSVFTGCAHVNDLHLLNKTDREIWNFSKKENYSIVTFDADFYDMVTLFGPPPKIIWLRTGNTRSENLTKILQNRAEIIRAFISNQSYSETGCLEIE